MGYLHKKLQQWENPSLDDVNAIFDCRDKNKNQTPWIEVLYTKPFIRSKTYVWSPKDADGHKKDLTSLLFRAQNPQN